jgi:hypothetical protein
MAHEQLQRLANESGCTVSLACADAPCMIYLDRCRGLAMPYVFSVGCAVDMVRTATGRAYVAALPADERTPLFKRLAPRYGKEWNSPEKDLESAVAMSPEGCLLGRHDLAAQHRRDSRTIGATLRAPPHVDQLRRADLRDGATDADAQWGPIPAELAAVLAAQSGNENRFAAIALLKGSQSDREHYSRPGRRNCERCPTCLRRCL